MGPRRAEVSPFRTTVHCGEAMDNTKVFLLMTGSTAFFAVSGPIGGQIGDDLCVDGGRFKGEGIRRASTGV